MPWGDTGSQASVAIPSALKGVVYGTSDDLVSAVEASTDRQWRLSEDSLSLQCVTLGDTYGCGRCVPVSSSIDGWCLQSVSPHETGCREVVSHSRACNAMVRTVFSLALALWYHGNNHALLYT
ncbi:hypothetical protein KIPB_001715 [Kipferlia bialata]|uniref:Uncharacterized protein n=1 Tax=Kipferlia bialata TaxID=797122 RepID=A0A9K3CNK3_9EUKA|nr:hypothetical protein KIPB_001247 [Kipferlia bialata]GIQ80849.1 hypothetical protein KIPB_001715 [Kipferlia bialata]|eukprot:g1247.t1